MKKQKKQLLSLLLAVTLIFGMLPVQVFAKDGDTVRVFVTDMNGKAISNATVTVEQRNLAIGSWRSISVNAPSDDSGIYTFASAGNRYYRITVTAPGYEDYTYTTTKTNPNNSTTYTATLKEEGADYQDFDIFYFLSSVADDRFPSDYDAGGDAGDYGPSGDNTPLVTIRVDIAKLRRKEGVVYTESGNTYSFTPDFTPTSGSQTQEQAAAEMAAAEKFWAAVWECTTDETKQAFEATGLAKEFVGYCLKKQGDGSQHGDGIMKVTPPVYVIEMYHNGNYFAGEAVDATHEGMDVYDVLTFCENYIGCTITWEEDKLGRPALVDEEYYQGTYVTDTHLYKVTINQREINNKPTPHASELIYYEINSQYYLAQFEVEVTQVQKLVHTVVYTDGVADEVVYNDHTYAVNNGEKVPKFTGIYTRKGYTFAGWVLEDGDGTVLSDEQAQALTVNGNMTFHAVWQIVPKYEGRVELVLNGTYDAADHEAKGTPISAETIRGPGTKLYVKKENAADIAENYILLNATGETGVYTAQLENGNYYFFYSVDDGVTKISTGNQLLTINNENRTRYLFYNSVTYDLNGGTGGPAAQTEYHRSGYSVNVTDAVPTREGYQFLGWKDQYQSEDDKPHQSGAVLTADIDKAYTLTAQWDTITRATVNLTVVIDHAASGGEDPEPQGELEMNLMYRPKGSSEPYVEVVGKKIINTGWYDNDIDGSKTTTVTYPPFFADFSTDYEYSANAFLYQYTYDNTYEKPWEVNATTDADGNVTYDVTIRLKYNPDLFQLNFSVKTESSVPEHLIPKAVDIKVISYDAQVAGQWAPISRHKDYSMDVELKEGIGSGAYNVPMHRAEKQHYYYRVRPVGFTLADGTELVTEVPLDGGFLPKYLSLEDPSGKYPKGAFYAFVTVDGGKEPNGKPGEYVGAFAELVNGQHVQNGTIEVTICASFYNVTFDPNGGKLNGSTDKLPLKEQFIIPDLQNYIPTREGGYVFDGWYLADENGNMTATQAVSNTGITEDVTLVAKWREPITIQGQIAIAGSYVLDNNVHIIQEAGRLKEVVVALQHIDANGYAETYRTQTVPLTYKDVDVDGDGDVDYYNLGLGNYEFTGVHDEDHQHRILVFAPNYSTLYQNEPVSLDEEKVSDYRGSYNENSFFALNADDNKKEVVNAYLSFTPDSFDLEYEVDASKIGATFRPDCVEILVTYDGDPLIVAPHKWPVISQMVFGEENRGIHTQLDAAGKGSHSLSVWKTFPDGATVYDYGIRVEMTKRNEVETVYDADSSTFTIAYVAPAHWTGTERSQILQATLIPKQYPIHYVLDGGSLTASCPTTHTWSHETDLSKAIPVRTGYAFEGWYVKDAQGNEMKAPATISAEIAAETTLYAKWAEAKDQVNLHVIVNHMHHEGGETNMYDNPLVVKLKRTDRGGTEYTEVSGQKKEYKSNYWHTVGDGADEEESYIVPVFADLSCLYDYTLDVSMDYYTLAKEPQVTRIYDEETGATTHEVTVTLQFAPDLLYLDFTVQMDKDTKPWLYPEYVNVKVTCWYATNDIKLGWNPINQHKDTYVQVEMGEDGIGTGSYPVWQWEEMPDTDGLGGKPWYYRIEPVELVFANGAVVSLEGGSETYTGGNYTARVEVAGDCVNPDQSKNLSGVYGVESGKHFVQSGTLTAVISATEHSVAFHTNLPGQEDLFRTYVPFNATGDYQLTEQGTIEATYDLPTFDATTHNNYIFKGWYLDPDDDSRPIRFDDAEDATVFAGVTDVYAHWIEVGEVAKNPEDDKQYDGNYQGFDLVGVQIRKDNTNQSQSPSYHGTAGAGLRFVAVLSQDVYNQIEALSQDNPIVSGAEKPMEYGFVVATKSATDNRAKDKDNYTLEYNGMVNGVDTTTDYGYAVNMVCSGPTIIDHYSDETYRLFTAVITYKGSSAETLKGREFVARAYLRYNDANGLYRTHYNNYESEKVTYGGLCISYNGAMDLLRATQ